MSEREQLPGVDRDRLLNGQWGGIRFVEMPAAERITGTPSRYWHPADGGPCPICGCPEDRLDCDVIQEVGTDGELVSIHDVVDCPNCGELWREE